jgi:hypothetical protein
MACGLHAAYVAPQGDMPIVFRWVTPICSMCMYKSAFPCFPFCIKVFQSETEDYALIISSVRLFLMQAYNLLSKLQPSFDRSFYIFVALACNEMQVPGKPILFKSFSHFSW